MNCYLPPPLKPGDLLKVIAPSGALRELEVFEKGIEIWRSHGYKVEVSETIGDRFGYLAGKDRDRTKQLLEAWNDPECKGILCARGGYGSARILENWTWKNPHKWLIGFSDITCLLWSLFNHGKSSVHGAVLTTLASEPDWSIERLFNLVEGRPIAPLQGMGWGGGIATGILLPANLTVATHLLGTPLQPNLEGIILALEDVTEAPYRIDRLLTQWRLSGVLTKVSGIALGRFSRCTAPENVPSMTIEEVLRDRLSDLNIPIVSNLSFGHGGCNAALLVGAKAQLNAESGILDIYP
jgi:muramoyltetrapeptide carboxypeptidase